MKLFKLFSRKSWLRVNLLAITIRESKRIVNVVPYVSIFSASQYIALLVYLWNVMCVHSSFLTLLHFSLPLQCPFPSRRSQHTDDSALLVVRALHENSYILLCLEIGEQLSYFSFRKYLNILKHDEHHYSVLYRQLERFPHTVHDLPSVPAVCARIQIPLLVFPKVKRWHCDPYWLCMWVRRRGNNSFFKCHF